MTSSCWAVASSAGSAASPSSSLAVFFVVMAVHNGWIGVTRAHGARVRWLPRARHASAAGSTSVTAGRRRHQRPSLPASPRLYASDAATALHYHLVSPTVGLVDRRAVGALALFAASAGTRRRSPASGSSARSWRRCSSMPGPTRARSCSHDNRARRRRRRRRPAGLGMARGDHVRRERTAGLASWLARATGARLALTLAVAAAFWLL